MELEIFVATRLSKKWNNELLDFGKLLDWEKSKSVRNILKAFLSLPRKKQLQMLNSCQEEYNKNNEK